MVFARLGMLSLVAGIVLMTLVSGTSAHLIGLGVWWFGALLLIGSVLPAGRATQVLWGIGVGGAVLVYASGLAVTAADGAGKTVVAALTAVLGAFMLKRTGRSSARPATSDRSANGHLRSAMACWDTARNQLAMGQPLRAGLTYQEGINHLLSCVSLTRLAGDATADDLVGVYHAMGAMGREGIPVMAQKATTPVRLHARMTLAAAHLADPAEGRPELITEALAAEAGSSPEPDLKGDGPLSAETRIAGAAAARLLVARLMAERPGLRWEAEPPWLVGSGGPVSFVRERKRFRQAVLPSCTGLAPGEEMRQLAQESVLMYTELCRTAPGYAPDRDRAKEVLAAVQV
jgi:hypothetical protein